MEKKYKVSEIASILGITPKTVYKYVENNELRTCKDMVNNREITFVLLTEEELLEKKEKYSKLKGNYPANDVQDTVNEQVNYTQNQSSSIQDFSNAILSLNEQYFNQLNESNNQLKEYINRSVTAEQKLMLIEDKQKNAEKDLEFYKSEYFKIKQEKEAAEKELEGLKEEVERLKKPWFMRGKK